MNIDIERDNEDVNRMVLAAKYNRWDDVRTVLMAKPYLINCIPESRAWAALHQAVYWNRSNVVTQLLNYETCDANVKTKQTLDESIAPSSTAEQLAQLNGYNDIQQILTENVRNHRHRRFGEVPRFVSRDAGQIIADMGFPLFVLEVVMYKDALLNPHANIQQHLVDMMLGIFINEVHQWHQIEGKLYQAMYGHCKASADMIRNAHATNEATFFRELIRLYTGNHVYCKVNEALGREFEANYRPAADELALGLYAFLLDLILTFWSELEKVDIPTYRGVGQNVTDQYVEGTQIMFTTMLSCSRSRHVAANFRGKNGTMFIFENSVQSPKRPRRIEMYSEYRSEEECLYVLGTSFEVVEVNGNNRIVRLRLL